MCLLTDKDLRIAGSKNTAELLYDSFKRNPNSLYSRSSNSNFNNNENEAFKIDPDGLNLAYKYLTSSTLTVRLCGVAQMNVMLVCSFIN